LARTPRYRSALLRTGELIALPPQRFTVIRDDYDVVLPAHGICAL
jgi:hypothetical protein